MSWTTLLVLVAGFGSGVLASVLGVGGAVITTPMIRALGATPIAAVGSTTPAIIPGAISGSLRYQREGYINWRVAWTCGLSGFAFALVGAKVADVVDASWLMILTALLVMWSGWSLLRDTRRPAARSVADSSLIAATDLQQNQRVRGGVPAMVMLGVGAGFLAGLLGIGGGVVLTPGLTLGLRLPVKHAIATSLTAVAMMSVASVAGHIYLGHVDWEYAVPLAIGIIPGARAGARITVGASDRRMRLIAGTLLIAVSIVYLGGELVAL